MKNLLIVLCILSVIFGNSCSGISQQTEKTENPVIENILSRKSVRDFIGKKVENEKITILLKAGMAAPSGRDLRPWELIVIQNRSTLDSMAAELPYAKMLNKAPMAIIVCGDSIRSSYWYLDCSAVSENILLAAESLELGAVWTAAYPYEDRINTVRKYTNIPENIIPLCVIPIGYPNGSQSPKNKFDEKKIHYEKF
ncbi:MAG: nitroreductase family protein [Tannerella sp.]|uniref:nitroreductase family protein n=1 Tax=uncultured Coprobacter sp. TaxID=1720550 RepID=UPI0026187FA6|nr:nitroreductase family protein [uncultured Coprobacter sp.]MBS6269211.1 nitroreductase family protein [Tannerella sp.]